MGADCLPGCVNPAEGLHHWRCPNYAHAEEVQRSLQSADEDRNEPSCAPCKTQASAADSVDHLEYRGLRRADRNSDQYRVYMLERGREGRGGGVRGTTFWLQALVACASLTVAAYRNQELFNVVLVSLGIAPTIEEEESEP